MGHFYHFSPAAAGGRSGVSDFYQQFVAEFRLKMATFTNFRRPAGGQETFTILLRPYCRQYFYHFAPKRPNFYPTPTLWCKDSKSFNIQTQSDRRGRAPIAQPLHVDVHEHEPALAGWCWAVPGSDTRPLPGGAAPRGSPRSLSAISILPPNCLLVLHYPTHYPYGYLMSYVRTV